MRASTSRRGLLVLLATWGTILSTEAEAEPSGDKPAAIDEIVVYARKRAELIEETPVSITVFNESQLQATGTTRIDQIQEMVPNLTMLRGSNGQTASFNLRGVGNFPSIHFDQGVGVYVDGVYLSRNAGTILDIVDTQSVEVLRGPQGTLFGKNTLGGAVNITTIKPMNETTIDVLVRAGSYDQVDTRATLNVPIDFHVDFLEDRLFGRFTFASFYNEGYTYNSVRDEHASDRNSINFLGSLRYLPTDDITIDISGTWSKSLTRGLGGKCIYIEPENVDDGFQAIINSVQQIVTSTGAPFSDYRDRCNATTPYRFEAEAPMFINIESYGAWGVLQWELGDPLFLDDLTLKYTSGWREQNPRSRGDLDQTAFPILSAAADGGGPVVEGVDTGGAASPQRQIQQELQVNADAFDDRLSIVGGVFGFWENAEAHLGTDLFPGTDLALIGQTLGDVSTDNWNWAVYGQATAELTDWLSLTGGIRFTMDKKGVTRLLQYPNGLDDVAFSDAKTFTNIAPMGSISLTAPESWTDPTPIDHLMGYFTYAEGFRGGGFNGDARTTVDEFDLPFKPETIQSLEWGIKSLLWDRRVSVSLAYFRDDRTDQQIPQGVTCDTCIVPLPDILITNAGQSSAQGFEAELSARPLDALLINGSVGYLDATYDDFPETENMRTGEDLNRAGQRFSFLPEWQTHLGAQYSFDIAGWGPEWTDGTLTPRIDWSWQSKVVNWSPELPELLQPSFHLVNLRSTYSFNDDDTTLAFFVNNVTDEAYFRDSIAIGPRLTLVVGQYYEPPRWWGVEISQSF